MRANKKYYFIYLVENLINGKKYVGFHSTHNINDLYYGSGSYIKKAIKKYRKVNFKREILEFCNSDNWQEREKFWINKIGSKFPNGYNFTDGGKGGEGKIFSESTKSQMRKTRIERGLAKGKNNGMFGNNHTEESKKKMSKTRIQRGTERGSNNPRFDHTIYKFKNIETGETFEGYKFNLANKIGSLSCHINAVITGRRNHHKKWILV
jgi:group I intron endonuclease